jgi:hypothetical protein
MPKIAYVAKNFGTAASDVIDAANRIVTTYQAQGFSLTLRQLYYQFVSRGLIANRMTEYKRLGGIINDARLAGLIDWNAIEDRTRNLRGEDYDSGDPDTWLASIYEGFSKARWVNQPYAIEVWVEKDALIDVVERAARPLAVSYFACRGYTSQSELWGAAMRMVRYARAGKQTVILHLGDHDPSGIDMTRDIEDRMRLFCEHHGADAPEIRRLALNMDQVRQYDPPPNPAKLTDSRSTDYIRKFGDESWELDALEPQVLADLITANITPLIDYDLWNEVADVEDAGRQRLKMVADRWKDVIEFLQPA